MNFLDKKLVAPLALSLLIVGCNKDNNSGADTKNQSENYEVNIKTSVQSLDLTKPPTTLDLMEAGQLGGQLDPTYDMSSADDVGLADELMAALGFDYAKERLRQREMLIDFGVAIEEWNNHDYKSSYLKFEQYASDYPESPWTGEAKLHMACEARYNGRYSEAALLFEELKATLDNEQFGGAQHLRDKAQSRLAVLKAFKNDFSGALKEFDELRNRTKDWRLKIYADAWILRIHSLQATNVKLLDCGVRALGHILKNDGKPEEAEKVINTPYQSDKGHSLKELINIAKDYNYTLSAHKLTYDELIKGTSNNCFLRQNIHHKLLILLSQALGKMYF